MNLDLSLMTLFGEKNNRRFKEQEKRRKKNESNVKCFHVYSRNTLSYLFGTDRNTSITASYTCKKNPRFQEFVAKVHLVHRDGCKDIGCVVDDDDATLNV